MSDKQRAEFEKWLQGGYNKDWLVSCNGYADPTVDRMWISWQAAIESVVVELPVTCCRTHVFELPFTGEVGMEHDEYFEVDDIKSALDAAGVKYK